MIYTCFFIPNEGVHPHAALADYARLWPIMKKSVNDLGHPLVHITDEETESWGDECVRVPGLRSHLTVHSRDVAWLYYLATLQDGEQACMIEPDTVLLREVPPIKDGFDLVLLRRPEACIPGWFKLSKRSGMPFFQVVVDSYIHLPIQEWAFHGDIKALHRAAGIAAGDKAGSIPCYRHTCHIEIRDWPCYGFRKPHARMHDQVMLQFKGHSKSEMLKFA